ncbi:MAG: hemolysin III family protein [Pseudolabrys sp.]
MHAIGVCLGLLGAVTIVVISINTERVDVAPILVYVIGLVTMLAFSAAYNMWPVSPAKWVLRRFDHSAIYLLIAGTYTPFLMQMKNVLASASLGIGVWSSAVIGMALKLALPGRFDRLAVILCLLLGWSGIIAYDSLATLPSSSLWLLAIGGILYTLGTLFHVLLAKSRTSWRISRRCADILVIESARLFIHSQGLSRSVSTSAFDARGVLLTCCELDFGSVQSSELLQAGWLA